MTDLTVLHRLRWAVRAVLLAGVAASVAANVLHATPHPVSQVIAAWPPLALLVTVELIARVPVHRPWLAVVRWSATAVIAGIAAWVSYWHIAGVAAPTTNTAGPKPNSPPTGPRSPTSTPRSRKSRKPSPPKGCGAASPHPATATTRPTPTSAAGASGPPNAA